MKIAHQTENEQAALWGGTAGQAWVEMQAVLDHLFKPLEDLLLGPIPAGSGGQVLDVGCGTGGTTLAMTRLLGTDGHCIGVDISEPLIAAARTRAERERSPAGFIHADAQTHVFEPGSFDLIISRFGVMFFNDFVRAFANLKRAASSGAILRFVAWRSPAENPFMTTAERAAAPLLPDMPARRPNEPGQFALADRNRIHAILDASGWTGIDIRPVDVACAFPRQDLVRYLTRLGPLGRILHEADEPTRGQVIETVRAAFDPYVHGTEVRFDAACWLVTARAEAVAHVRAGAR